MAEIRFITEGERAAFRTAIGFGFGEDPDADDTDGLERFTSIFPLETSIAAFDADRIVGTFGSFDFEVTVPGGSLPMAGTTVVTVHPPYRRQGILSTMMRMHLDQAVDRGQPLAGLWASEATIYERFGYGIATEHAEIQFKADAVTMPAASESITLRFIDHDDAMALLPPIYDAVAHARAGMLSRSEAWWKHRRLARPEQGANGAGRRRFVLATDAAGTHVGYTAYRQKSDWTDEGANGEVQIVEIYATTEEARRTLWNYLAHIDLFPNVRFYFAATDEPIIAEVADLRSIKVRTADAMWIRILDVVAALTARTYETDGSTVIGVRDTFMPAHAGSYRLTVEDGTAVCEPTDATPDVELDVAVLGSLYLGGGSALTQARAGHISGDDRAVRLLGRMFRTSEAPYCPEVF